MLSFQKNIAPFLAPQAPLLQPEATPDLVHDVSMCVALKLGWKFEHTPAGLIRVISDDGDIWDEAIPTFSSGDQALEEAAWALYNADDIQHYAWELDTMLGTLGALWSDLTAHFHLFPAVGKSPALVRAEISTRYHHVDFSQAAVLTPDVQGRPHQHAALAPKNYPALALALAYLKFDPSVPELR